MPDDRAHLNSCAGIHRGSSTAVNVSGSDTVIQTSLSAALGSPVLLTVITASSTSNTPTSVFLDASDGEFFPMQNDTQPGHFWVVVPPQMALRVVTSVNGGAVGLPAETISSGGVGASVSFTVNR